MENPRLKKSHQNFKNYQTKLTADWTFQERTVNLKTQKEIMKSKAK